MTQEIDISTVHLTNTLLEYYYYDLMLFNKDYILSHNKRNLLQEHIEKCKECKEKLQGLINKKEFKDAKPKNIF